LEKTNGGNSTTQITLNQHLTNNEPTKQQPSAAEVTTTTKPEQPAPKPIRQPCLVVHFQSTKIQYDIIDMDVSLAKDFVRGTETLTPREMEHVVAMRATDHARQQGVSMSASHNNHDDSMSDDSDEETIVQKKVSHNYSSIASHAIHNVVARMNNHRKKNVTITTRNNVFQGLEGSVVLKSKKAAPQQGGNGVFSVKPPVSHIPTPPPTFLFGQDAVDAVNDVSNSYYTELIRPMKYGHFVAETDRDMVRVEDMFFSLWQHLCFNLLKLTKQQINRMPVVYITNEEITETEIHMVLDVLLCRMGFNRALLHNELVLASMSVGMNHVCVCDIGATKTSIGCVSDGECTFAKHIAIGVHDMSRFLGDLLEGARWPVENFPLTSEDNQKKLRNLFVEHASVGGLDEYKVPVTLLHGGQEYQLEISDPLRIAGTSLMEPNMFHPHKSTMVCKPHIPQMWSVQQTQYLQNILTGISRRKGYGHKTKKSNEGGNMTESTATIANTPVVAKEEEPGEDDNMMLDEQSNTTNNSATNNTVVTSDDTMLAPLHQLIIEGIKEGKTRLRTSHRKSKVKVNLVFCGGGARIEGLQRYIADELAKYYLAEIPETGIEVYVESDDKNPQWMAWRGACLLTRVDVVQTLWIERREYAAHSNKEFLEKTSFIPSGLVF